MTDGIIQKILDKWITFHANGNCDCIECETLRKVKQELIAEIKKAHDNYAYVSCCGIIAEIIGNNKK